MKKPVLGVFGVFIVLLLGGCATLERHSLWGGVGTWVNPEYENKTNPAYLAMFTKIVIRPNGTIECYWHVDDDVKTADAFVLNLDVGESWSGDNGANYFEALLTSDYEFGEHSKNAFALMKISSDGQVLEWVFIPRYFPHQHDEMPSEIDPGSNTYYKWRRM